MYIFNIPEVEEIIFNYLDSFIDLSQIRIINVHYKNFVGNNLTFSELNDVCSREITNYEKFWYACQKGYLNAAKYIKNNTQVKIDKFNHKAFGLACIYGHYDVAKWLFERKIKDLNKVATIQIFKITCNNKHLDIAMWLCEIANKCLVNQSGLAIACETGNLNLVKQLDNKIENRVNYDEILKNLSNLSHMNIIKWLIKKAKYEINVNKIFEKACTHGYLETAQWWYKLNENVSIRGELFEHVCESGHLVVAQWLLELCYSDKIKINLNNALKYSCENNQFIVAKWLYNLSDKNVATCYDKSFYTSHMFGNIKMVKWLMKIYKPVLIDYRQIFYRACLNNNLDAAKCILNLCYANGMTNILSVDYQELFRNSCIYNYLDMAKWIYKLDKNIDIHFNDDQIFEECCSEAKKRDSSKNNFETIKWLFELDPIGYKDVVKKCCDVYNVERMLNTIYGPTYFDDYYINYKSTNYERLMILLKKMNV